MGHLIIDVYITFLSDFVFFIFGVQEKNHFFQKNTSANSSLKKCQKDKILKATWKSTVKKEFEVNLKIVAKDTVGFGAKLLGSISHLGVNITKIFAKQKNSQCEFKLTLKIKDVSELKKVAETISKVEGVKSINRSFD